MDIGYLAPGLDGHMVRLGIGRMGLRKNVETLAVFFTRTNFSFVDPLVMHC
jgi:hypothetical protein